MTSIRYRQRVLDDISGERDRQQELWGEQNHTPEWWFVILSEEIGEIAETILHWKFGGPLTLEEYRMEMVQSAAVIVAALECLDRSIDNTTT